MPKNTYGPQVKARVKRLLEALLAFVNYESEQSFDIELNREAQDSTNPKLIFKTTLVALEQLTAKDKYPDKLTKTQIREALNLLKDFLKILEDNRTKTKGSDDWHFTLTLWSKDKEKNLKQFEQAWEDSRPEKSKAVEANFKKSDAFGWHNICLAMLEAEKPLTTNQFMRDEDEYFELDEIHVPLALVERKKTDKRGEEILPEQGSRLYEPEYEEKQRFEHEQFLQDILKNGKGKHNGKRIAIIGEPGAGKTTLLHKIAFWVKDNTEYFPISISLADLQEFTLEDYLLRVWLKTALKVRQVTPEMKDALCELFKSERVWLLLDSVDEMPVQGEEPLWAISNQLKGWVAQARVVLTFRLNVWEANRNVLADKFEIYRTLDFSYGDSTRPDRVEEFIAKWFNKEPNLGQQLRQELDKPGKERIKDLAKNPLRLALLCSTWKLWREHGGLPDTKAKLYQGFVKTFYAWKDREFPTTCSQRKQLNRALGELAKLALDQTASRFRLKHTLVCHVLGQPDEGLFELALQLGWLNKVGLAAESPDETVYAFWHPTFEEYFAALAVDEKVNYWNFFLNHVPQNPKQGIYRIFEPQWKEVILLWLGRENVTQQQKEEFIQALVGLDNAIEPPFYQYRAIFLAAAGIAEFTDSSWANQIVTNVVTLSFGIFDNDQKTWRLPLEPLAQVAKSALLETERTKAIKNLLDLITQCNQCQQEDVYVQVLAVLKKISNENSDVIEFLEKELSQSNIQSLDLRQMIAEALGHISGGNKTAILTITKMIKNSSDSFSIQILCNTLETIGKNNPLSISVLEEMLEDYSKSKELKIVVGTALWNINHGNQKAVAVLVDLVKDTHYYDRFRVFEVISKIIDDSINEEIVSALTDIVRDNDEKDEFAKILSFKILLLIPDVNENVFDDFINLVQGTTKNYIYHEVIKNIERINCNHEKSVEIFMKFINSRNDNLRLTSACNLCKLENYRTITINTLEDLISNAKDELLRCEAAYFLAQNDKDNRVALETLNKFAKDRSDDNCRERAAIYLTKLFPSNEIAIKALEELATNCQNEQIRRIAAINLGYYQPKNSIPINCLFYLSKNSQHELIRGMTTENLGNLGLITPLKPEVINALVELLTSSESSIVCKNAADALKNMINSKEQKSVIVALKNYLSKQIYINYFGRFYYCYDIVWHCAQNLSYPDFYQAWHQETLTNSATTNLNLANLP